MIIAGFRNYRVFENVTEGDLDSRQAVMLEVTNKGAQEVKVIINDCPLGGHPVSEGIPVAAGATRTIPVLTQTFKSTGAVDVVAYIA